METETRSVLLPRRWPGRGGFIDSVEITLKWVCPICGGPRGEPSWGRSYDGSHWTPVSVWENPCGHLDTYVECMREIANLERTMVARVVGPDDLEALRSTLDPEYRPLLKAGLTTWVTPHGYRMIVQDDEAAIFYDNGLARAGPWDRETRTFRSSEGVFDERGERMAT